MWVSGDVVFFEQISREGFRCFQAGEGAGGSHRRNPRSRERVHNPMPQGFLRADNGKIDACLPCKGDDTCRVIVTSDADYLRNGGDAGVFRFHERIKPWFLFRSQNGLGDGVFPCAVADEQNTGHQEISFRFCLSDIGVHIEKRP